MANAKNIVKSLPHAHFHRLSPYISTTRSRTPTSLCFVWLSPNAQHRTLSKTITVRM